METNELNTVGYFSPRFWRIVWPLAVAETLLWASIYYVFPALIPRWLDTFGWTRAEITGAFTLCVLISAGFAPVVGHFIDRGFGRVLMGTGGAVASVILVVLSQTESKTVFYLCWMIMGAAQAALLYEPCFAILTRIFAENAKRAITAVTLLAGLAGTVSFPLAHWLAETVGWRHGLLVFAAIVAVSTLIAIFALKESEAHEPTADKATPSQPSALRVALGKPVFWLLAMAFTCLALNHGAVISHLLLMLDERNVTTGVAVLAASLIGPMQVAGRVGMMGLEQRGVSTSGVALLSFIFVAMAAIVLYLSQSMIWLVFAFVVLQGAGYGVTSITRPAVTAEFLGRNGFGAISGAIAIPTVSGFALGPTLASVIWGVRGYDLVIGALFAITLVGMIAFLLARRLAR